MRIIVLVKPGAELGDSDACAVEHALNIARRRMDVQVTLLTAGSADCVRSLRSALALGADDAVHVADDRISPYDALTLSRVYADVATDLGFDLVVCGRSADTPNLSLLPELVAARLATPVTAVSARSVPPRHPSFPAIAEARQKLISTRILPSNAAGAGAAFEPAITVRIRSSCPNTIIYSDPDPHAAAVRLVDFLAERRLA
jgi:electron transfer flavoprotein beta subunit